MTLRVGLVGAGPWAAMSTGPMLAAGPATALSGIWARRPAAARELAGRLGVPVFEEFGALLDCCDAVAFAVPPDVQAELAPAAAAAGRHLLLEKPLALTVADVERITDVVAHSGVVTQLLLTNRWTTAVDRFTTAVDRFLAEVRAAGPRVLNAEFLGSSACPGSPFATPWRRLDRALYDVGPHVLDLVQAAAGTVTVVHAATAGAATAVTLAHEGGAVSSVTLSIATPGARGPLRCEALTDAGRITLTDPGVEDRAGVHRRITDGFAAAVTADRSPEIDVQHGLRLQRLLAAVDCHIRRPR